MIRTIKVYNEMGGMLELDMVNPGASGYSIRRVDGLTPPKAVINSVKLATVDGVTVNSTSVAGRNILITLGFEAAKDIEAARLQTYEYFPIRRKVRLLITTDKRTVQTTGYVESNEPDIFSEDEGTKISILCEEAWLTDASETGLLRTLFYSVEKNFEFPLENRSLTEKLLELGRIVTFYERSVEYLGDVSIGLTMTLTALGDIGDVTIFNPDRNESFIIKSTTVAELTGQGISAGDLITVNTRIGKKSVTLIRAGVVYNIMKARDRNSTWLRLHKGPNRIAYSATYGASNLQLVMETQTLYEGV